MFEDVKPFLQLCSDKEIFELECNIGSEILQRIVSILKAHDCSSIEFSNDNVVEANVNDVYGVHHFEEKMIDKWVPINEVGFTNCFVDGEIVKNWLYVNTTDNEVFCGDEINETCLWDLYKEIKDAFEKYDKK